MNTEIYAFDLLGEAFLYSEVEDTKEGALKVWKHLKEKYLFEDEAKINEIISLISDERLEDHEKTTLLTTLENVVFPKESLPKIIEGMEKMILSENIEKQKEILKFAKEDPLITAIAWNHAPQQKREWPKNPERKKSDKEGPYNFKKEKEHITVEIKKK